jgi:hypothetical protein
MSISGRLVRRFIEQQRPATNTLKERAMRYLMFISHSPDVKAESAPPGFFEKMDTFVRESFSSGVLKATGGLLNTKDAARIKLQDGRLKVTDGPFTEAKELIGGYAIVEVADRRQAMDLATRFMELHRQHWPGFDGQSEVRPMEYYEPPK